MFALKCGNTDFFFVFVLMFGFADSDVGKICTGKENRRYCYICRCDTRGLVNPDRFAVHEAKKGHDASSYREHASLSEIAIDDKRGDSTEDQASQDRAATHHAQAMIHDAGLSHFAN